MGMYNHSLAHILVARNNNTHADVALFVKKRFAGAFKYLHKYLHKSQPLLSETIRQQQEQASSTTSDMHGGCLCFELSVLRVQVSKSNSFLFRHSSRASCSIRVGITRVTRSIEELQGRFNYDHHGSAASASPAALESVHSRSVNDRILHSFSLFENMSTIKQIHS
jgi:hypothetical protein